MSSNLAFKQPIDEFPTANSSFKFVENLGRQPRPAEGLRILYSGPPDGTCLQRAESLRSLGAEVVHVRSGIPSGTDPSYPLLRVAHQFKRHPDLYFANSRLLRIAKRSNFDIVWIDKGLWLRPRTLRLLRAALPEARMVSYSGDDMGNPGNQSKRYFDSLPLYDLHVTTKSYNVAELEALGAREMLFLDNSYDPAIHRPLELCDKERVQFGAEVGFVGAYEAERADLMLRLAEAGIPVTVRGPKWVRFLKASHPNLRVLGEWMDSDTYPRSINATKINLGFLRKVNRDLQTTRSIEIPACRAFLLAERTDEHRRLFREGIEAEFFDGFDELLEKCRHYLAHESERLRIAERGHRRCILGGYSYEGRLLNVVDRLMQISPQQATQSVVTSPPDFRTLPLPTRSAA